MPIEIRAYLDETGRSPFETWFDTLDPQAAAKVTTALTRLEHGNTSNIEPVGSGVSELRIHWGPGYRIYFGKDGSALVILLCGGTKKRQPKDIQTAKDLWKLYKTRKTRLKER